jgi:hypothetical protein
LSDLPRIIERLRFLSLPNITTTFGSLLSIYCSIKLANWLGERNIDFCLRLKKNELVEVKNDIWLELKDVGL